MADYRGSAAYDLSLFEPQVVAPKRKIEQVPVKQPARQPAKRKAAPQKKSQSTSLIGSFEKTVERNSAAATVSPVVKKIMVFAVVCFSMIIALLAMRAQCDKLSSQITAVESKIEIAKGEKVRLNAEMSSIIASDKIDDYAENKLGMVKAESYQITYLDLSDGDKMVVSGDKAADGSDSIGSKLKELFAYIF